MKIQFLEYQLLYVVNPTLSFPCAAHMNCLEHCLCALLQKPEIRQLAANIINEVP